MPGGRVMILVIDNYDSFTYNLVQYLGELGAELLVIRNDALSLEQITALQPRGIVLSPGPGIPEQAGVTLEVIRRLAPTTAILGVCLGHQALGQCFGGRVVRAPAVMHGKTCKISHDGRGVFRDLSNPLTATRYHSLVVERSSVPQSLEVSATSDDGLIMGLRHRSYRAEGVQFHPESISTIEGKQLLGNFLSGLE